MRNNIITKYVFSTNKRTYINVGQVLRERRGRMKNYPELYLCIPTKLYYLRCSSKVYCFIQR